jgi:hypothetical protein
VSSFISVLCNIYTTVFQVKQFIQLNAKFVWIFLFYTNLDGFSCFTQIWMDFLVYTRFWWIFLFYISFGWNFLFTQDFGGFSCFTLVLGWFSLFYTCSCFTYVLGGISCLHKILVYFLVLHEFWVDLLSCSY